MTMSETNMKFGRVAGLDGNQFIRRIAKGLANWGRPLSRTIELNDLLKLRDGHLRDIGTSREALKNDRNRMTGSVPCTGFSAYENYGEISQRFLRR